MYKKTITFEDYNGEMRKKDYYFNFTTSEIAQMQHGSEGGLDKLFARVIQERDEAKMYEIFKEIILKSYGEISPDGTGFIKKRDGHRLAEDFEQTAAFDVLYVELGTNVDAALDFCIGILPKSMQGEVKKYKSSILANKDRLVAEGPDSVLKALETSEG